MPNYTSLQSFIILLAFTVNTLGPMPIARADDFRLPSPGTMVHLSPPLEPAILKGIKIHPDNPFRFDFILDVGDGFKPSLETEATKLIKYFLASLTIPEKDLWVNLSPYEKDRIIPPSFGQTEMGRDLLAEDYMLKQITASLIYPEDKIGKKFWKRIYEEAAKKFGTTNISVNTFNKVWIVPEKAVVYENTKAGTAYVVESKLKVMLEQDYLSMSKHANGGVAEGGQRRGGLYVRPLNGPTTNDSGRHEITQGRPLQETRGQDPDINKLGSDIVREIVIPELTKEINEGQNFAQLRQVYNSLILATWYKKKIKAGLLAQVYTDRNKIQGLANNEPNDVEAIYQRYLQAFKKGVYNYIKEDIDPATQQTVPRKYFSGGWTAKDLAQIVSLQTIHKIDAAQLGTNGTVEINCRFDQAMKVNPTDSAKLHKRKSETLSKIRKALKKLEGKVMTKQIAEVADVSDGALRANNYRQLIDEENARRAKAESDRVRVEVPLVSIIDYVSLIREDLKKLDGKVTRKQIAEALDIGPHVLDSNNYRQLIDEENARRAKEEPDRAKIEPPIELDRNKDPLGSIKRVLKKLGGKTTKKKIAEEAHVSGQTLFRYNTDGLIAEENARRAKEDPLRAKIVLDAEGSIKEALRKLEGKVTAKRIAEEADISLTDLHRCNYRQLIEEENARRLKEEPDRAKIEASMEIDKNRDVLANIKGGLKKLEGKVTTQHIAKQANVGRSIIMMNNYRQLIEEENARRAKEEPGRAKIEASRKQFTGDPVIIIKEVLKKLDGRVTKEQIAEAADVSGHTLYAHHYRQLIDEENARRAKEEPLRAKIFIGHEDSIKEALKKLEGRVTMKQIAEAADVGWTALYAHHYRQLIDEENARRAKEEPGRSKIEAFRKDSNINPETIIGLTLGELLAKQFSKEDFLYLSVRYSQEIIEILWRIAALQLQGQYDKERLRQLFNQKILADVIKAQDKNILIDPSKAEGPSEGLSIFDATGIQKWGDHLRGVLDKFSQAPWADQDIVTQLRQQSVLILRKMEEQRFLKKFYSNVPARDIIERTQTAIKEAMEESSTNPLIAEALLDLLIEVEDCLKLTDVLHADGLAKGSYLNLYQLIAVKRMVKAKREILADEMGLGKTLEAITTFLLSHKKEMIVMGPNQVLTRWVEDLYDHTDTPIELVILADELNVSQERLEANRNITVKKFRTPQERHQYLLKRKNPPPGVRRIVLVNYEALPSFEKYRTHGNLDAPWPQIKTEFLVLDEAHWLKNQGAQRSQTVFGDGKKRRPIEAEYKLLLTGTPLENGVRDLLGYLKFLAQDSPLAEDRWMAQMNPQRFGQLYRSDNLEKLSELYGYLASHMIRRLKDDVVSDLPAKKYVQVDLDPDKNVARLSTGEEIPLSGDYGFQRKLYTQALEYPQEFEADYVDPMADVEAKGDTPEVSLTQLVRMGQVSTDAGLFPSLRGHASIKLDAAKALIKRRVDQGRHVVVFTEFKGAVHDLKEMCDADDTLKGQVVTIEGDIDLGDRNQDIEKFQSGQAKVLIATRPSAGLGVNLTRADTMIILNYPWKPSDYDQMIDRVHRIDNQGRHYPGKVIEILNLEYRVGVSIDDIKRNVVNRKRILSEMMVNGNFSKEVLEAFEDIDDSVFDQVEDQMKETQALALDKYEINLMQQFIQRIGQASHATDAKKRQELWDQTAAFYTMILERKGSFFANMALLDWLSKQHKEELSGGKALDLGSGPSTLYRAYERVKQELSRRGVVLDISEIDASPQMLAQGVVREGRQYLGSFEAIDQWPENSFNLVNLSYAYRYVTHPALFMHNVHRILRRNGLVSIILPEKNEVPAGFSEALTRLGFDVLVGQGGYLQSQLDTKSYSQLMLEYGKEFADDLAKHANGRFTLIVARKERAIDLNRANVNDKDLRLTRALPVDRNKLKRVGNMFEDKFRGLGLLIHGAQVQGDVVFDDATEVWHRQVRQEQTAKFAERVGRHLSNLLGIIHSDIDKKSTSSRQRRRNYQKIQRGLDHLLNHLTEMKDAQDLDVETARRIKEKVENFKTDKKVRQWFEGSNLNEAIVNIDNVLADRAMTGNPVMSRMDQAQRGGIDLTAANMHLQTRIDSPHAALNDAGIPFHIDSAMLTQLQNAPGFVPVIIHIQPMKDLRQFLGVQENASAAASV